MNYLVSHISFKPFFPVIAKKKQDQILFHFIAKSYKMLRKRLYLFLGVLMSEVKKSENE